MNAQAGLPEVLANRQRRISVTDDLALGSVRGAHISIRSSRFRLIDANGAETLVPNLYLDVVIIRANPKTSKLFYPTWDPNNPQPPTCYSDNGVAPSSNAMEPQSPVCVSCPHNQMNSKINPQTGKGTKACKDLKKLACIVPGDPAVNVYELQVPPDSLGALKSYSAFLSQQATGGQRKVDIGDMVTRLTFDAEASHPRLKFEPVGWADDTYTLQMIDYIYDQKLDVAAVGLNDAPADPELVKHAIGLRAQYAQLAPQQARPPDPPQQALSQFQFPLHDGRAGQEQFPPRQESGNGAAPPFAQSVATTPQASSVTTTPAQAKRPGRPKKQPEPLTAPPAPPVPQFSPPTPAAPVAATSGMPDIPEFLRRPAVHAASPVSPPQPAQPQPSVAPQYGMAGAPPPPPQVAEALHAAMRMPPRR